MPDKFEAYMTICQLCCSARLQRLIEDILLPDILINNRDITFDRCIHPIVMGSVETTEVPDSSISSFFIFLTYLTIIPKLG